MSATYKLYKGLNMRNWYLYEHNVNIPYYWVLLTTNSPRDSLMKMSMISRHTADQFEWKETLYNGMPVWKRWVWVDATIGQISSILQMLQAKCKWKSTNYN